MKGIGDLIFKEAKGFGKTSSWYAQRLNTYLIKEQSKLFSKAERYTCGVTEGELCFFGYNPKLIDKLPYYDTRPLVYILQTFGDGFYGYNLHYTDPSFRSIIAKSLTQDGDIKVAPDKCFRKYLCSQITNTPMKVPKDSWESVAKLPTENFVSRTGQRLNPSKVWSYT